MRISLQQGKTSVVAWIDQEDFAGPESLPTLEGAGQLLLPQQSAVLDSAGLQGIPAGKINGLCIDRCCLNVECGRQDWDTPERFSPGCIQAHQLWSDIARHQGEQAVF